MTDGGNVPIEQIQAGDLVWAWDEETGDVALKPVVKTYINETTELTHVFVDGEEIVATPTHPFYCPAKGWTDAAQLRAGDILVLVNGEYVVVEWVQHELLESPVRVYNFQVADYHTSYVASGLLLRETYTQNGTAYTLDFVYDQSNRPYILNLTTTTGSTTTTTAYYYLLNLQGDVLRLVNENGVTVAGNDYDPCGNILPSTGSLANLNPLRYRGYYYDSDTGFYYLQSRYYDPAIGRFINADFYTSTGQGFIRHNMFAYCNNCPTFSEDSQGTMACAGFYPDVGPVDALSLCYAAAVVVLVCSGYVVVEGNASKASASAVDNTSVDKVEKKAAEAAEAADPRSQPTVIYRYGCTNPGNLTPKTKDIGSGLSFSTIPAPGAAVTTIELINLTGVVYAVRDGVTHVSVRPVNGTMQDWVSAGSNSIWTQAVRAVLIKVGR